MPPGVCTSRLKLMRSPNRVKGAKLGQPAGQAAQRRAAVLGTIMAIHPPEIVAGSAFREAERRNGIVFAPGTWRLLVLAGFGRLQQRNAKLAFSGGNLLRLRRHLREPAIGRIDDPRRSRAGAFLGCEHVVIGAGDVGLGPALEALLATQTGRSQLI